MRVHAEYRQVTDIGMESVHGDITTQNGRFVLELPGFYHQCILDLSASDTTKWNQPAVDSKKKTRKQRKRERLLKKGRAVPMQEHQWIMPTETEYPEFYVRLTPYYPRFCKPFSYYHTHVAPPREGTVLIPSLRQDHTLAQVTVRSSHGGLRGYDASHPAVVRDAYELFNECIDAGFTPGWFAGRYSFSHWVQRLLVGDMNMYRHYTTYETYLESNRSGMGYFSPPRLSWGGGDPYHGAGFLGGTVLDNSQYHPRTADDQRAWRYAWVDPADQFDSWPTRVSSYSLHRGNWSTSNGGAFSFTGLDAQTQSLDYLRLLRAVQLITDYAPRMEGSRRYWGSNQPTVDVGYDLLSSGKRPTYRDRHYVLHGFDVSEEFYSPCYRERPLPSLQDYRRTLYWNPNLELDENGHADVTLWNNSLSTSITVSAEGITPAGKILTGISYPEDRER